jgi:hypothetical protein
MQSWWGLFVSLTKLPPREMGDLLPGLQLFRLDQRPNDTDKAGELNDAIGRLMEYTSRCRARVERLECELQRKRAENRELRAELCRQVENGCAPVIAAMAEGAGAIKH